MHVVVLACMFQQLMTDTSNLAMCGVLFSLIVVSAATFLLNKNIYDARVGKVQSCAEAQDVLEQFMKWEHFLWLFQFVVFIVSLKMQY